jgi:hypothetical protein
MGFGLIIGFIELLELVTTIRTVLSLFDKLHKTL